MRELMEIIGIIILAIILLIGGVKVGKIISYKTMYESQVTKTVYKILEKEGIK